MNPNDQETVDDTEWDIHLVPTVRTMPVEVDIHDAPTVRRIALKQELPDRIFLRKRS